ncbi:hypothetical protein GCM10009846_00960 [Agrococcus versicolor]|uniref:Uncharacterized protein n=1 Tax=Agrococcus versicolor TaxID=501482 RepID=A0ABP5M8K3_9MICO
MVVWETALTMAEGYAAPPTVAYPHGVVQPAPRACAPVRSVARTSGSSGPREPAE